jgi:hypothetical protein
VLNLAYDHVLGDWKYRAMIYTAVSTIHFYRKDYVRWVEGETYGAIVDKNRKLVDRVREEILNIFEYDLSDIQIAKAFVAYGHPEQSVDDRPAYTRPKAA